LRQELKATRVWPQSSQRSTWPPSAEVRQVSIADLLARHMQLKAAKVLPRRHIWRPAEEGREGPHVPNVIPLGVFGERRAVMSSIMR